MNKLIAVLLLLIVGTGVEQVAAQAESWEPQRINKVIELWESGQPVYYTGCGECTYEDGLRLSQTPADYINFGMEHEYVDIPRLREFMRGLVDGGPTPSGHRTPTVIAVTPAVGWTEAAMRGNTHMMQYILSAGAHGILLTHAVDPAAVKLMVEAVRYPFARPVMGLAQGMRGSGSSGYAADIWGIDGSEYLQRSDVWPLNPDGEVILGLKIENVHGVENAQYLMRVPGISFAEWGPGDNSYWLGASQGLGRPFDGDRSTGPMAELRSKVFDAVRSVDGKFLNSCNAETVIEQIDEGVMICTGGTGEGAEIGRRHTNRQMPW